MLDEVAHITGGDVMVRTTNGRGHTPEEIAEMALDKIIFIGNNAHPAIRDQAEAYKAHIHAVLLGSLREAVSSHNVTLANKFHHFGHPELIPLLDA